MKNESKAIDLTKYTDDVRSYQEAEREAFFEIGRILTEVKALEIPAGQFTDWLESVGYNPRTAQRYMQIYNRFHAIPEAQGVPVSKLTEFLSLPADADPATYLEKWRDESSRKIRANIRKLNGKTEPIKSEGLSQNDHEVLLDKRLTEKDEEIERLRAENHNLQREKAQLTREVASLQAENLSLQARLIASGGDNGLKVFAHMVGLSDRATPTEIRRAFIRAQANADPDTLKQPNNDARRNWVSQRYNTASDLFQRMYC